MESLGKHVPGPVEVLHAAIMRSLPLLLLSLVMAVLALDQARGADLDYGAPGPFAVREVDAIWTDTARQRDLPLRARLPETGGRRPTILFSHGLGGSRAGGAEWGEQWASHGFAVIHVQHPGSDESLWKDRPVDERLAGLKSGANLTQFLARIADIKFVVSELGRRQTAGDTLAARVDLERLGMSGHSFGAITTLYLGGQRPTIATDRLDLDLAEPRFAAFLAFSPQATGSATGSDAVQQFTRFTRPTLLVTGTLDGQPFPGLGASPAQRLVPFDAMAATGNKFLLVVAEADHMYFNGTRGLRDIGAGGRDGIDFAAVERRGYRLVKAVSTAYWQAYLQNDDAAMRWLKDGAAADLAADGGYFKAK
jgi:predicted dienelactone hydrolase